MRTVGNALFVMIAMLISLIVLGHIAFDGFSDSYEIPTHSYIEARDTQPFPDIDMNEIASGKFQKSIEKFLSDSIPMREDVLLSNAFVQRSAITLANTVFGFEALPTYYGSNSMFCPSWEAVVARTYKQSKYPPERLDEVCAIWSNFITQCPDTNWCFAFVDRTHTSAASPAYKLTSSPADYEYYRQHLMNALPPTCTLPDLSYTDTERFFEDYFKTDHHWKITGGIGLYTILMDQFNREPIDFGPTFTAYEGPFYGSSARQGLLATYSDSVLDVEYEASAFSVTVNGEKKDRSYVDESLAKDYAGFEKKNRFESVYAYYFHGDPSIIEYENEEAPDGTLLIVGDSFTDCIDRFFAESYKHVYVVDPRFFEGKLAKFARKLKPDDAVIIVSAPTLTNENALENLSKGLKDS